MLFSKRVFEVVKEEVGDEKVAEEMSALAAQDVVEEEVDVDDN